MATIRTVSRRLRFLFLVSYFCCAYDFSNFNSVELTGADEPRFTFYFKQDEEANTAVFGAIIGVAGDTWFSVGHTSSGGMIGADMAIFQPAKNGTVYTVADYWSMDFATPQLDTVQNLKLLHSLIQDGLTTVVWERSIASCDQDEDLDLQTHPNVIFAIGSDSTLAYHAHRGSSVVDWANGDLTSINEAAIEPDAVAFPQQPLVDMVLSGEKTDYQCVSMPLNVQADSHLIKTEYIIDSPLVHHMIFFACDTEEVQYDGKKVGHNQPFACGLMPPTGCNSLGGWAVGRKTSYMDPKFGILVKNSTKSFFIQYHYDNYLNQPGLTDRSGVRLFLTPTLRENHQAVMAIGVVSETISIPAGQKEAELTAEMPKACSSQMVPDSVTLTGFNFHAHQRGTFFYLEHWRDGKRLADIGSQHWDFNFQTGQTLPRDQWRDIRRGDELRLHCIYDTSSDTKPVLGGDGSDDEMCLVFMDVFPPPDIQVSMNADGLLSRFGMSDKQLCVVGSGLHGPSGVRGEAANGILGLMNSLVPKSVPVGPFGNGPLKPPVSSCPGPLVTTEPAVTTNVPTMMGGGQLSMMDGSGLGALGGMTDGGAGGLTGVLGLIQSLPRQQQQLLMSLASTCNSILNEQSIAQILQSCSILAFDTCTFIPSTCRAGLMELDPQLVQRAFSIFNGRSASTLTQLQPAVSGASNFQPQRQQAMTMLQSVPSEQKQQIMDMFQRLTPEQRQQAMSMVDSLSPEAQQQAMSRLQSLSPEVRQQAMLMVGSLSPEVKQKAMSLLQSLTPEQIQQRMSMLQQIPSELKQQAVSMLQSLDSEEIDQATTMLQRISPERKRQAMDMMQSLSAQEKQEAISVALSLMQSCRSVMGEQVQNQIRTICFSNSGVDTVSALQSCSLIPTSCRVALSRVPPQFIQRATSTTVQTQTNAVQVAAPQPAQTADAPAWWPDWAGPYTNNFATSSYAETIPAIPAYIAPRYTSHTAPSSSYVVPSHTTSATPAYSAPSYTAPMYTAPAASSYPAPSYTASASPAYTATSYTSPMYTAPVPASPAWWPDWAGPYTGSPSTFGSPSLSHSYTPAASYTPIVSYMPVEFMESNTPSFF